MDTTLLLSFALIISLFLISTWVFLLAIYRKLTSKFDVLATQAQDEDFTRRRAQKIIDQAHQRSLEIVYKAEKKAQDLLLRVDAFDESAKSDLHQKITQASQQQAQEYLDHLKDLEKQVVSEFHTVSASLQKSVEEEIGQFREQAMKDNARAAGAVQQEVGQEFAVAKKEIDQYRQDAMARIDAMASKVVEQVAREVLGRSLSSADHHQLVMKALEEAKRSHVFENS
jgi:F0F1-type ATP synthase membrane subunit b/b'